MDEKYFGKLVNYPKKREWEQVDLDLKLTFDQGKISWLWVMIRLESSSAQNTV